MRRIAHRLWFDRQLGIMPADSPQAHTLAFAGRLSPCQCPLPPTSLQQLDRAVVGLSSSQGGLGMPWIAVSSGVAHRSLKTQGCEASRFEARLALRRVVLEEPIEVFRRPRGGKSNTQGPVIGSAAPTEGLPIGHDASRDCGGAAPSPESPGLGVLAETPLGPGVDPGAGCWGCG